MSFPEWLASLWESLAASYARKRFRWFPITGLQFISVNLLAKITDVCGPSFILLHAWIKLSQDYLLKAAFPPIHAFGISAKAQVTVATLAQFCILSSITRILMSICVDTHAVAIMALWYGSKSGIVTTSSIALLLKVLISSKDILKSLGSPLHKIILLADRVIWPILILASILFPALVLLLWFRDQGASWPCWL